MFFCRGQALEPTGCYSSLTPKLFRLNFLEHYHLSRLLSQKMRSLSTHPLLSVYTTLVRFFMDSRFNKNGGTLIFTTHYPELLDEYDRNDGIYIVRNCNGITVENLSYILTRNDIKRSYAYQSGFLEGTTPTYEAYIRLKESLI